MTAAAARAGETPGLTLKLYRGATHACDARGHERYAYGHRLVHHPEAAADSFVDQDFRPVVLGSPMR